MPLKAVARSNCRRKSDSPPIIDGSLLAKGTVLPTIAPVVTARPYMASIRNSPIRAWLGPREYLGARARLAWLAVAIACATVLGIGAYLRPDPRGLGTHEALGLPPCSFVLTSGLPCPTCGMTTAYSLMLHGHPIQAFLAQPAGAVLCLGTVVLLIASVHFAIRGYMVSPNWVRLGPVRTMLCLGFLLLFGWGFKIVHGMLTGAFPIR